MIPTAHLQVTDSMEKDSIGIKSVLGAHRNSKLRLPELLSGKNKGRTGASLMKIQGKIFKKKCWDEMIGNLKINLQEFKLSKVQHEN